MEGEQKQKQQQPNNVVDKVKEKPHEAKKCPRCGSFNTKFCYYNNYSMSQPRHLCKACKRYWTQGGTTRNVPIGAASRKAKRAKTILSGPLTTLNSVTPCQFYPSPTGYVTPMPFGQNITCFGQSSQMGSGDIVSNLGMLQGFNAFSSMTYPSVDHRGMFLPLTRPTGIMTNWSQSFINNTQASTSNVAASTNQTAMWNAPIGNNTNFTNGENPSHWGDDIAKYFASGPSK